ncbi:MAG: 4-alpha-glucanotransferase [Verrucomicrobia bacterium]|nr:4-alpha-glucanotransferase [Verrucomicrobiota bacterium]
MDEKLLSSLMGPQWKRIGIKPHHGIDLPLASLRSANSCGIGEFFDLIPLIDWCSKLKLDVIQLLPLNDTALDPSPYNANSSCALHFIYLSLHALPYLRSFPTLKQKLKDFQELSKTPLTAYQEVYQHKLHWLRAYFDATKEKFTTSKKFAKFIADHPWVHSYALYKALCLHFPGISWLEWPQEFRSLTAEEIPVLMRQHWAEVSFQITLQYLCYTQLKKVKKYAGSLGVHLMGDIPILISRESADVWHYPEYFNLHLLAGAPPDKYNTEGQIWGFPLFQWEALQKNNYDWWTQRLRWAEHFFDLYRIDHILGFFRIWAIPHGASATEGHYLPTKEAEWGPQGEEALTHILPTTKMLPIAEDLGLVPDAVHPCLDKLGVCGTRVMRWEREWETDKKYTLPTYYSPLSLTCLSTHDSETLAQWWTIYQNDSRALAAQKKWTYSPILSSEHRLEILYDSHHTASLFHINLLQEYLALYPELVWDEPHEERINVPGKILPTNWNYRYRPTVEEITSHSALFASMQKILQNQHSK